MKRDEYPPEWEAISLRIRERDGWRCYWCGARQGLPHPVTGSCVVLTVHHWNHDKHDNRDLNLAALCQRCHLSADSDHHRAKAAETRRRKKYAREGYPDGALFSQGADMCAVLCNRASSRSEYCATCLHGRPHEPGTSCDATRCKARHLKVSCRPVNRE